MKESAFLTMILCGWAALAAGQEAPSVAGGPPLLSQAKLSADGQSLEVQRHVQEMRLETRTRKVPEEITEEVDGQLRTKTVYREVQETITVPVTKTVCMLCAPETIEVRTTKGGKYKPEDIAKLFTEELTPVILVERYLTTVDGKQVTKLHKFDTSYLALFHPDALIVLLPPSPLPTGRPPAELPSPVVPTPVEPAPAPPSPKP